MTYQEACEYLFALPRFGRSGAAAYRPGFERIERLLDAMDRPESAYPSVHVAGTNGKGSVASMIAAVGTAAGLRMGLHTSPHLFSFTERMRIDGEPADRTWIARSVERFRGLIDDIQPSFFEISVALSLAWFADQNVDWAVVEVGLGGRLDATNVLRPKLGVITHIGMDHQEQLGSTLERIAREKAGILKPGMTLITGPLAKEAAEAVDEVAVERGVQCIRAGREYSVRLDELGREQVRISVRTQRADFGALVVGLGGSHQADNAGVAVAAADFLWGSGAGLEPALRVGLGDVVRLSGLRGRFEIIQPEPLIVADVAHNAEGFKTTLDHLRKFGPGPSGHLEVVVALMRDKPLDEIAKLLVLSEVAFVHVLPLDTPRAFPAVELVDKLRSFGLEAGEVPDMAHGLKQFSDNSSPDDVLLITGSHLCVAQLGEADCL